MVYRSDWEIGDQFKLTEDALENYGYEYRDIVFTVDYISRSVEDHPGYDELMGGEALLDAVGLEFSVYEYEVERV